MALSRRWTISFLRQFQLIHLVILLSPQIEHALLCNEIIVSSLAFRLCTRPHFLPSFPLYCFSWAISRWLFWHSSLAEVWLVLSRAEQVPFVPHLIIFPYPNCKLLLLSVGTLPGIHGVSHNISLQHFCLACSSPLCIWFVKWCDCS